MKNRIIFNFSFHVSTGSQHIINLICEGIPYTLGIYEKNDDYFRAETYIFQPGYGTSSCHEWTFIDTEDYAKQWLIEKAIPKILAYYPDTLPDKR